MSLVNPLREGVKSRPSPLVSPRSQTDSHSRSSKHRDSGLFRPFDSHQMINGYDNPLPSRMDRENRVCKSEGEDKKCATDQQLHDIKYEKESRNPTLKSNSSSNAFHSLANHISKLETDAQILSHSVTRDNSHSIVQSGYSAPLNVPSYNASILQSHFHRSDPLLGTQSQICVSKLDLEAEKRKKSESQTENYCSDSECDFSNEEDNQERQLLISSGPPLKLDTSPKKIKLLSELGLTTFSNKKGILTLDFALYVLPRLFRNNNSVQPSVNITRI